MMRYSVQPRDRMSKNIGKNISKNLIVKYN